MSQTASSKSAVTINHPHVYTQDDQFLISIPIPEDIAAIYVGVIRDSVHESRYDEIYYSPDGTNHLNITGVGTQSVDLILDTIEDAGDEIRSLATVATFNDGRVFTTDISLVEDGVLNPAAHERAMLMDDLKETEFWDMYIDATTP